MLAWQKMCWQESELEGSSGILVVLKANSFVHWQKMRIFVVKTHK